MGIEQLAAALVEAMKGMDSLADADGADPRYSPAFMALEDALALGGHLGALQQRHAEVRAAAAQEAQR